MLRSVRVGALAFAALLLGAGAAGAQSSKFVYVGAGMTMPTGDYKEYAKSGFMVDLGLGTNLGSSGRFVAFADVIYGKNSHDTDGDSTTLMGAGANLMVQSSGTGARVYGYGGLGMQSHKYNSNGPGNGESESQVFGRGALGLSLGSGKATFWAEIGMIMGDTSYLPILAGISIGL